jgi:hypothetical protein
MITISPDELDDFLICTFRYTIFRQSYIVDTAIRLIRKYHRYTRPATTRIIIDDLERTNPEKWDAVDRKAWLGLLEELKKSLTIPWEENPYG